MKKVTTSRFEFYLILHEFAWFYHDLTWYYHMFPMFIYVLCFMVFWKVAVKVPGNKTIHWETGQLASLSQCDFLIFFFNSLALVN